MRQPEGNDHQSFDCYILQASNRFPQLQANTLAMLFRNYYNVSGY